MRCTYSEKARQMYQMRDANRMGHVVKLVGDDRFPQFMVLWDGNKHPRRIHRALVTVLENNSTDMVH